MNRKFAQPTNETLTLRDNARVVADTPFYPFERLLFVGVAFLNFSSAKAQNLFMSSDANNTISEFTPSGAQSAFGSGMNYPQGPAFNGAGNLFAADCICTSLKVSPLMARAISLWGLAMALTSLKSRLMGPKLPGNQDYHTERNLRWLFNPSLNHPAWGLWPARPQHFLSAAADTNCALLVFEYPGVIASSSLRR